MCPRTQGNDQIEEPPVRETVLEDHTYPSFAWDQPYPSIPVNAFSTRSSNNGLSLDKNKGKMTTI